MSGLQASIDAVPDLESCAREPIHLPGTIQPYGVLLVFDESTWVVTHASANTRGVLGFASDFDPVGKSLAQVIGADNAAALKRRAAQVGGITRFPRHERMAMGRGHFDLSIHHHRGRTILELEAAWVDQDFELAMTERGQRALDVLSGIVEQAQGWEVVATMLKNLSGLDRVMIYRFDDEANGEVIAEAREAHLEPFLGLHYPASDIPPQARKLYETNLARYIPDIDYVPVPVLPPCASGTGAPLDLGMANLRGISPVHIEYLRNMGVRGTLVISLMANGRLWGLIACHHYRSAALPFATRRWMAHLGQMLGAWLGQATTRAAAEEGARVGVLLEQLQADASEEAEVPFAGLLARLAEPVRAMLEADGLMLWSGDATTVLAGELSPDGRADLLARARHAGGQDAVWVTDAYGMGVPVPAGIGGVLVVRFDDAGSRGMAAWRLEQQREVRWAGNPHKAVAVAADGVRLSPRRSFAVWLEVVRGRSLPWSSQCMRLARGLANAHARFDSRRRVQDEIRSSRDKLVSLGGAISRTVEGVLMTDARLDDDGPRIVFVNQGLCDMTGFSAAELIGATPRLLQGAGTDRAVLGELKQALRRGESFRGELLNHRKDGRTILVDMVIDPIRDDTGRVVNFIAMRRDVGARREMEQELARLACSLEQRVAERTGELERTIRDLESFDYTIAHDLRAPLRNLTGFASLLREADGPDHAAERRAFVDRILASAAWMSGMLDGLLAFARSSRADMLSTRVSNDRLVAECVMHVRERWPKAAFTVAPLPACRGDERLLRQVWFNLLENAAKYSAPRPESRVEVDFSDGFYRVRDNGTGFEQKDADKLFGIFARLHPRSEFEGSGVGMAIVKRIVERHHGVVTAEGRPDAGATFRFSIGV